MNESTSLRQVRSFARRERPLSAAAQALHERLFTQFGIPEVDWVRIGENGRPLILDIGFGDGEGLLRTAAADPRRCYVGVEVYRNGVTKVLRALEAQKLPNVRLIEGDAQAVVATLKEECLDEIHVFFPDPWPKARHHKRRLVQRPFLQEVVRILRRGGVFHMATDWVPYAEEVKALVSSLSGLRPLHHEREGRPVSKFERRGERLGHECTDLRFMKVS